MICGESSAAPVISFPEFPLTEIYVERIETERVGYLDQSFHLCPNCGHDFYRLQTDSGELKDKSSMPVVVGVLLMIASILNIGNGLIVGSVGGAYVPAYGFCGMVEVLIGIVTIPGAIAAMNRQHFVPVGIVSVLTLFSVGPCFICSILGLIAIIGLFASHDEFDKG